LVPPPFQNQIDLPQRSARVNCLHQSTESQSVNMVSNSIVVMVQAWCRWCNPTVLTSYKYWTRGVSNKQSNCHFMSCNHSILKVVQWVDILDEDLGEYTLG
jgi:hypothetical protein